VGTGVATGVGKGVRAWVGGTTVTAAACQELHQAARLRHRLEGWQPGFREPFLLQSKRCRDRRL
jgi:hypothetical protein